MAVIPIVLEGQRQPVRRPNESKYGRDDNEGGGRRGSYGRIIAANNAERKGSAYTRKGSYQRIPLNPGRRGSYGRIGAGVADCVRRGSLARKGSGAELISGGGGAGSRRGSVGRGAPSSATGVVAVTVEERQVGGGPRRGSIARRGSENKLFQADHLLNRRSSGANSRHLVKKGSRQNLKSFQIKISIEGEKDEKDEKDGDEKAPNKQPNTNNTPTTKIRDNASNTSREDKENLQSKDKKVEGRWTNVDRGVAHVRGGGGIQLEPININNINSINNLKPLKSNRTKELSTATATSRAISTGRTAGVTAAKGKPTERSSTSRCQFNQDATDRHNKYRLAHGAKPLILDAKLSQHAQNYAEKLANSCTFQHSGDPNYGENLYWAWSSDPSFSLKGCEAVDSWYEESLHSYNYAEEPTDTESGHFTQLVWKRSERLGVGLARSSAGRHVVVMKYDPPGNYVGQYTSNVRPPARPVQQQQQRQQEE